MQPTHYDRLTQELCRTRSALRCNRFTHRFLPRRVQARSRRNRHRRASKTCAFHAIRSSLACLQAAQAVVFPLAMRALLPLGQPMRPPWHGSATSCGCWQMIFLKRRPRPEFDNGNTRNTLGMLPASVFPCRSKGVPGNRFASAVQAGKVRSSTNSAHVKMANRCNRYVFSASHSCAESGMRS